MTDIWTTLQERLARAARSTEESFRLPSERARAILQERARRLAQSLSQQSEAETVLVAVFSLGSERYALEAALVREVRRQRELTPLPGVPDYCAGLVSLRGHLLPVFALGPLLGLSDPPSDYEHIIFLGKDQAELGLLAQAVSAVLPQRLDTLLAPDAAPASARPYLRGVTAAGLIVLDAAALLDDPRLVLDQNEDLV